MMNNLCATRVYIKFLIRFARSFAVPSAVQAKKFCPMLFFCLYIIDSHPRNKTDNLRLTIATTRKRPSLSPSIATKPTNVVMNHNTCFDSVLHIINCLPNGHLGGFVVQTLRNAASILKGGERHC